MSKHQSDGIYILTQHDLDRRMNEAFQKGVARGKFEAAMAAGKAEVALNCFNWKDGRCETCGVQWQQHEVSADFKCPHFLPR